MRRWALAEAFAQAAQIDAMRVDVFLFPGHPDWAVINENSLTSAATYYWHSRFMARIWADGHTAEQYSVADHGEAPVHALSRGPGWFGRWAAENAAPRFATAAAGRRPS